ERGAVDERELTSLADAHSSRQLTDVDTDALGCEAGGGRRVDVERLGSVVDEMPGHACPPGGGFHRPPRSMGDRASPTPAANCHRTSWRQDFRAVQIGSDFTR